MYEQEYILIDAADALSRALRTDIVSPLVTTIAGAAGRYAFRAMTEELGDTRKPTPDELRAKAIESLVQLREDIGSAISVLQTKTTIEVARKDAHLPAFTISELRCGKLTRLIGYYASDTAAEKDADTFRARVDRSVYAYSVTEIEDPADYEEPSE